MYCNQYNGPYNSIVRALTNDKLRNKIVRCPPTQGRKYYIHKIPYCMPTMYSTHIPGSRNTSTHVHTPSHTYLAQGTHLHTHTWLKAHFYTSPHTYLAQGTHPHTYLAQGTLLHTSTHIPGSRHTLFGSDIKTVSGELRLAKTAVVSAGGIDMATEVRAGTGRFGVMVAGMVGMLRVPIPTPDFSATSFSTIFSADLTAVGLRRFRIQF